MLKTYLYLPDDINREIVATTQRMQISKAAVIRQALAWGIVYMKRKQASPAQSLRQVAEIGVGYDTRKLTDVSVRMDEYLWGSSDGN
jgi:hypothetical protein